MRARFPWALAALYAVLFTGLGALRYAVHRNFVDFGIFAQTVASAFGCFCNPIEGSHWAFHFSPILYVAGIVLWFWRSPLALIALTAIPCALVIPPVYALVARRGNLGAARLAATVAFLYPPLAGLAFGDFHENVFAPAAVVWAVWAFDAGYLAAAVSAAIVAICVKEDQAMFVAFAGAVAAWRYRGTARGIAGVIAAVAGTAAALAFFTLIQPHAQANPHWSPMRFYAWTPADAAALVPRGLLERIGFLALVLVPLLFLPLRSGYFWLAVPPFAEVLLSRMSTTYTTGSHYAGAWVGYVLAAFAISVRALPPARIRALLGACIALCAVELSVANPMHPGVNLRPVSARDRVLDSTLRHLPDDVSIATQEEAYTHLALRDPNARVLPADDRHITDACLVLIDRAFPNSPRLQLYGGTFASLASAGMYRRVSSVAKIEIYRRVGSCR